MEVKNQENGQVLAWDTEEALSFMRRLKGLMFTKNLPFGSALHIRPCKSVHTYFMKYSIDVLYLDSDQRIIGMEENLQPGYIGRRHSNTVSVIELPSGRIRETETEVGHTIILKTKGRD